MTISPATTRPASQPTRSGPRHAPGRHRATRAREALTLVATGLGVMMTFVELTASVSALSAIQRGLHVSPGDLVWIPSAYTLMVASLVLSAGTIGNMGGRKRAFMAGVAVMIAGALTVCLAGSVTVVIIGQLITGVGGALIVPNSLAILGAAFPDPHRRTEVITAWVASSGVGLAIGPLISGALLNHFRWNAVFLSVVVLGLVTLGVTAPFAAESRQPGSNLDIGGQILSILGIASLVYAFIEGGHYGYTSPRILTAWIIAAAALISFVFWERRTAAPMLDMRLFRSASFSAVMLVAAVSLFGITGVSILLVLYNEQVQRLSALQMGWRIAGLFLGYVVVSYAVGRIIRHTGFKLPLTAGLVLGGVAALGLVTQDPATPYSHVWWLYVLFGAAGGMVAAPSTAAALVSVSHERAGLASGAVNAFRQVGSVLGASLLGTLLTSRLIAQLPRQLAAHHVPVGLRAPVEHAIATGSQGGPALPGNVTAAVADAFTSGVHAGLIVAAIVFLATSFVAAIVVRNRPHAATDSI